jgi:hypothetical protein
MLIVTISEDILLTFDTSSEWESYVQIGVVWMVITLGGYGSMGKRRQDTRFKQGCIVNIGGRSNG